MRPGDPLFETMFEPKTPDDIVNDISAFVALPLMSEVFYLPPWQVEALQQLLSEPATPMKRGGDGKLKGKRNRRFNKRLARLWGWRQ